MTMNGQKNKNLPSQGCRTPRDQARRGTVPASSVSGEHSAPKSGYGLPDALPASASGDKAIVDDEVQLVAAARKSKKKNRTASDVRSLKKSETIEEEEEDENPGKKDSPLSELDLAIVEITNSIDAIYAVAEKAADSSGGEKQKEKLRRNVDLAKDLLWDVRCFSSRTEEELEAEKVARAGLHIQFHLAQKKIEELNGRVKSLESRLDPCAGESPRPERPSQGCERAEKKKVLEEKEDILEKVRVLIKEELRAFKRDSERSGATGSKEGPKKKGKPKVTSDIRLVEPLIRVGVTKGGEEKTDGAARVTETWADVTRRRRRAAISKPEAPVDGAKKGTPSRGNLRRLPKTEAIILTCPKGTHGDILEEVMSKIDTAEAGITDLDQSVTRTGALSILVGGEGRREKADILAERVRDVLAGRHVRISRPMMTSEMLVTGLNFTATEKKIAEAIVGTGGCTVAEVRVGPIRFNPNSKRGTAWVRCPAVTANQLVKAGQLMVGWTKAGIVGLKDRPLRCFRCMRSGHIGAECRSGIDIGARCFRCGTEGHQMKGCENPERCPLCVKTGRPSDHRLGAETCPTAVEEEATPGGVSKVKGPAKAKAKVGPDAGEEEWGDAMEVDPIERSVRPPPAMEGQSPAKKRAKEGSRGRSSAEDP